MIQPNLAGLLINNLKKIPEISSTDEDGGYREGYLYQLLKTYNQHLIFAPIYNEHKDSKGVAIAKTAFIILSYTNKCTWLNFNKDRFINKKEILSSLLHDTGLQLDDDIVDTILRNTDKTMCDVINMYIVSQKDDLFTSIIAYAENLALGRRLAMENTNNKTAKDATSVTDNLNKLRDNQNYLAELKRQLKTTYSDLDEITRREGMATFTDELDLTDYETRLKYRMSNKIFFENNE
jgi:hypothetical protein